MADSIMFDEDLLNAAEADVDTYTAEEFDVDADYASPPPPLPDGKYEAELTLLGAKDAEGKLQAFVGPRPWGPSIPKTYFTQIQAKVVTDDIAQNGKTTSRFNVTTHPEARRNNASSASMVYKAMTNRPISLSPGQAITQVVKEFQGQIPRVKIETQLTGQAQESGKSFSERKKAGTLAPGEKAPKTFRGEKNFRFKGLDESGKATFSEKVTGRAWDEVNEEIVVGQPEIVSMSFIG